MVRDHNAQIVKLAWYREGSPREKPDIPPFPFPVYVLSSASKTAADRSFPMEFAAWFDTMRHCAGPDPWLDLAGFRFNV